jgi:hypothetical protein
MVAPTLESNTAVGDGGRQAAGAVGFPFDRKRSDCGHPARFGDRDGAVRPVDQEP